jgi:hypothetical protein
VTQSSPRESIVHSSWTLSQDGVFSRLSGGP